MNSYTARSAIPRNDCSLSSVIVAYNSCISKIKQQSGVLSLDDYQLIVLCDGLTMICHMDFGISFKDWVLANFPKQKILFINNCGDCYMRVIAELKE